MAGVNLDKIQEDRINNLAKKWDNEDAISLDEIFISERVFDTLGNDKTIVQSFLLPTILSILPFTPLVYVEICPFCINKENYIQFTSLVRTGQIVPFLIAPYSRYPDQVLDAVRGYDHVSCYEFSFYKHVELTSSSDSGLCPHCIDKFKNEIEDLVKGRRGARKFRRHLDRLIHNIRPFLNPDYELLKDFHDVSSKYDIEGANQLVDMSEAINSFRTAQAFNATLLINEHDFSRIPDGVTDESDRARIFSLKLSSLVSEGLGLKIPTDIDIDQYIEILQDFRPKLMSINKSIIESAKVDGDLFLPKLLNTIAKFNAEIERVKGLKRYMLYEAGVELVLNNKALVTSAFVASGWNLTFGTVQKGQYPRQAIGSWGTQALSGNH